MRHLEQSDPETQRTGGDRKEESVLKEHRASAGSVDGGW